ncbi:placenta-expressed transcript 1 protein [Dromiciops gliroides]|uniref:placenta-expressed transcript 1 protein n=1 Tax=Dromiciops gliroides TaxID=33562 RepID=UPI001CC47FDC|nr:placenta-expressed transcript 1 protein [Dromiciops gliroides]
MAALSSVLKLLLLLLLQLLGLQVLLFPGLALSSPEDCIFPETTNMSSNLSITADSNIYKTNKTYTVTFSGNENLYSVILQAVDKHNKSVGHWQNPDHLCNDSVLYQVKNFNGTTFQANWTSPNCSEIMEVEIRAFTFYFDYGATFSSLKLDRKASTPSLTTPKNSAQKAYNSSVVDIIQLLFVYFTSKLIS